MKVQVIVNYDTVEKVDAKELRHLIAEEKILAFHRAEGWVKVNAGPLRGDGGEYGGPERRNFHQKDLTPPENGTHFCTITAKH